MDSSKSQRRALPKVAITQATKIENTCYDANAMIQSAVITPTTPQKHQSTLRYIAGDESSKTSHGIRPRTIISTAWTSPPPNTKRLYKLK